jgi:hypothetical protein
MHGRNPRCAALPNDFHTAWATNGLMHCSKAHLYSITSSARASSDGGRVMPSASAVLKLITSSNLDVLYHRFLALENPSRVNE